MSAPRGQRANWMLKVEVGTQAISPFLWAVDAGSVDVAREIIADLRAIRADCDRHYYGGEAIVSITVPRQMFEFNLILKAATVSSPWRTPLRFGGWSHVRGHRQGGGPPPQHTGTACGGVTPPKPQMPNACHCGGGITPSCTHWHGEKATFWLRPNKQEKERNPLKIFVWAHRCF